jgi:DNA-binding transcriptional LysR family regulator
MDWDTVRFFLPVARHGSLTKAAEVLKTTQSTVSRRISELEAELGRVLFVRTPHGYDLTPEGAALLQSAIAIEDQFIDLERAGRGDTASDPLPTGIVRIATAENLATAILLPALAGLRETYPGLMIELATGVRSVSMVRREADLSLRLVRPTQNNLVVRRVGVQAHAVYASATYLARHGRPGAPLDLMALDWIGWDSEFESLQMAMWLKEIIRDKPLAVAMTSLAPQVAAANHGLGAAVLPCFLGDVEPGLRRLMEPEEVFSQEIWLTMDAGLGKLSRIRTVADWLVACVEAKSELLEGRLPAQGAHCEP